MARRPAVLRVLAVRHQNDDLVDIGCGGRRVERRDRRQRLPGHLQSNGDVGVAGGDIASTLAFSAVQSVDSGIIEVGASRGLMGADTWSTLPAQSLCQDVVVLVTIFDAAVPVAVRIRQPRSSCLLLGRLTQSPFCFPSVPSQSRRRRRWQCRRSRRLQRE